MKGKFVASARHLGRSIWKNRACYSLMLPGIIWFILFAYGPMSGLLLAFKTYSARGGIWGSPWCGFENFAYVFKDAAFFRSVWTTLTINVGRLLFQFPVPIILALLINECKWKRFNKIAQTIFTFPYFLSWVIVASIVTNVLSLDGMVNSLLAMLNLDKTNFLGNSTLFIPLLYLTESWKSAGWSAIIYLAALSGIDVDQYEAAELDGANRWQTLIRVTLPNLKPTILVMLVLSLGNLMTGGFDQIFNLSNPAVEDICEILDMYIYRITFGSVPDFGFSMAISLFRSVVNCIFLIGILGARIGFPIMDSIASLVIFIFIAKAAFDIFKDAIDKMVDHSCDKDTENKIYDCIMENKDVLCVDLLKTRIFGNKIYVDLEIQVNGLYPLQKAHNIAEVVHDNIEKNFLNVKHIMVHVNPSKVE